MKEFEINTRLRKAAFLAQLLHESGGFRYMQELGNDAYFDKYTNRADLGNTDPKAIAAAKANGKSTGAFYSGHGPIQITGYYNHLTCGEGLGLDLVNHPDLITNPTSGCRSATWFWGTRKLNALADKEDFELITRRINGGLNGLEDRLKYYHIALRVL